ncbi:hypothetical protein [Actinoplanes sp. G11-F43]|uniref:hypothetical protein n=1 Tax=Actinoplanes sp. G11-F43 TaxID=3424130 RepID=UPI003D34A707
MKSRLAALAVLTVVVLAGVAYGVNYLWDKRFGPTSASAADCTLAQQLIDRAQTPPTDAAAAEKWAQEIRQIRYTQMVDQGISTQVGWYVQWQTIKATGAPERPREGQLEEIYELAAGHCDDSGVELRIPRITF